MLLIVLTNTVSDTEYRALAELRYRIRHFIQAGYAAAQRSNLEPQQYLMLLAIRGLPQGGVATIRILAGRMALKHHSAVELINRPELHGLVHRIRSKDDKREVRVSQKPQGSNLLDRVAHERLSELKANGAALADVITALVKRKHFSERILEFNGINVPPRRSELRRSTFEAKTKQEAYLTREKKERLRIPPRRPNIFLMWLLWLSPTQAT
jgi:DNA-binding MarR family transcriptional regulator